MCSGLNCRTRLTRRASKILPFFHHGLVHSNPAKSHLDPWLLMGQLRVMSMLQYMFCKSCCKAFSMALVISFKEITKAIEKALDTPKGVVMLNRMIILFRLLMLCFKRCLTYILPMSIIYFASLLETS